MADACTIAKIIFVVVGAAAGGYLGPGLGKLITTPLGGGVGYFLFWLGSAINLWC
jgi:hypothetical protein